MMKWKLLAVAAAMLLSVPAFGQAVSSGKVTTAAPTYVNGTAGALSLDTSGQLRVLAAASGTGAFNLTQIGGNPVDNTIPGTLDINCVSGCVAGSGVAQGTATTSAPTYVDGTNNPLSLTLGGALRTAIGTALPSGTNNIGDVDVLTLPALPAGSNAIGTVTAVGNVAAGAADSGNPVKIGGVFNTVLPTITNGQRGNMQLSSNGALIVTPGTATGTGFGSTNGNSDAVSVFLQAMSTIDYNLGFNGTAWDRMRSDPSVLGAQLNVDMPTVTAAAGIASTATSAVGSNLVLKAGAGNLYSATITAGATDGYGMLFNATSAPADGAVTPANCWVVPANSTVGISYDVPYAATTGITVVFSSTGCFTKTASATAFISGQVK